MSEHWDDFKTAKRIKSLTDVAAVNLSEPSEGDLERVTKAYRDCREENQLLKESNETLNKMLASSGLSAENERLFKQNVDLAFDLVKAEDEIERLKEVLNKVNK